MRRSFFLLTTILLTAFSSAGQDAGIPVIPIPQQPFAGSVPDFVGAPAVPKSIKATPVPETPFMAPNGRSSTHLDAYQSDTYPIAGPLGHAPEVNSTFLAALCGTVTFDKQGRIEVVCVNFRPVLYLLDPVSLQTLARFPLPFSQGNGEFGAGGYFFLDNQDRAVIPTRTNDILRVKQVSGPSGTTFAVDHSCSDDLPGPISSTQEILSTFPDANGLLWFTTSGNPADPVSEPAIVGTANPDPANINHCTIKLYSLPSGERINKSFGVDPDPSRGGVFVVSDHQLYRFDAAADGTPTVTWHETYDRGTAPAKPGQRVVGSGTTPTLMGTKFVTIADNASPQMHVNVYLRAPNVNKPRLICSEPVFEPGVSDTFNSLIATERSISVENNYGYYGLEATLFGGVTEPGITRIDLDKGGGCHTVWTNNQESVPNVISQVSLLTGLEYTYSKDPSPSDAPYTDPWYFTAVDFHTGQTIYKVLAGTGIFYNSNYSSVYVGPDGKTAYIGVLGGLVRIHDTY